MYKFTCASCSSSYISVTCRHFKARIKEHIKKDNKFHVFKHLHSTTTCFDFYNSLSFKIIDKANSKFDLKIKELTHTSKSYSSHTFTTACATLNFISVLFLPFFHLLFFTLSLALLVGNFF